MADFNFYINRQGIQGRKGEKGDKGFSPTINVSTDTVDEYKLIIANEDNTFETPNLRGNINVLDNGGTYLRYDKETQQISAQDMDAATASTLGGVRLSTEENITAMSADTVVTPADVADALPVYLQGEGAVSITQDEETSKTKINVDLSSVNELSTRVSNAEAEIVGIQADVANLDTDVSALKDITTSHTTSISAINDNIASLNANKVSKTDFATTETAGVVKVDGTTIIVGENGTISSVGGGSTGDVTSDGDNTFTGSNTFSKTIVATGTDALLVDNRTNSWTSPQGVEFTKGNDGISHETNYNFTVADSSGNEYQAPVENVTLSASGDLILKANNNNISSDALLTSIPMIKDGEGNIILSQGNVSAGDNIAIENTTNGIKISGNADSYTKSETDALLSEKNDNIFDVSKFAVVGNPTITNDGVASGFSSSNYLQISPNINLLNFSIIIPFIYNGTMPINDQSIIHFIGTAGNYRNRVVYGTNRSISCSILVEDDNTTGRFISIPNATQAGLYLISFAFNGNEYSLSVIFPDGSIHSGTPIQETKKLAISSNNIRIGNGKLSDSILITGSIDLKHFSITVDGEEVFNGLMNSTKPIYDAIKVNNTELSEFKTETSSDFSAVNSALNEKANLSDLALKQNKLVSGTNIKTINGQSVLGEGDITVGGSTPTNMVTTDTAQTISGNKTFSNVMKFSFGHSSTPSVMLGTNNYSGLGWYGGTYPAKHFRLRGSDSSADTLSLIGWESLVKLSNKSVIIGVGKGSPTPSYLAVAPNSVTFKKVDGTTVDLLNQSGGSAIIDDTTASTTTTYSSSKIEELIGNISTALDSINGEVI